MAATGPSVAQRHGGKRGVFVVDNHPLLRFGLRMLINQQEDLEVCGEADGAMAALQAIAAQRPDIVVIDIALDAHDGLDLLKSIRVHYPDLPVLVLSMREEAIYAERALRARANGYVMKHESVEKVLVAIRRVLNGEVYLSDRLANKLLRQYIDGTPTIAESRVSALSDRELEVYSLIGEGKGTRTIAEELHLSVKTVETYQAHIKEKLSLRSGRELIQHAIQWKIREKSA
jgi:DNA-binding NarL/FixJ family response regulator